MKVQFFLIGLLLAVVGQAAVITAPTTYGPLTWACINGKALSDTIDGVDTTVFYRKQVIDPDYAYCLAMKTVHIDSSAQKIEMLVYGSDGATLMQTMLVDTAQGDSGVTSIRYVDLPVGKTIFSNRITLQAIGFVADSSQLTNRVELWRAKLNTKP